MSVDQNALGLAAAALARIAQTDTVSITASPYNAVGDDSTDNTTGIQAALDYLGSKGGGILIIPAGRFRTGALLVPSSVTIKGVGRKASWLIPHPSMSINDHLLSAKDTVLADSVRHAHDIAIEDVGYDGSTRTALPVWLSKLDGTSITDPQNDYFANGGKIGNAAYAADVASTSALQQPGAAGNLTINGTLASAGAVSLSPAVRQPTITSVGDLSARTFTIYGTDINDAALQSSIAGPNANTVRLAGVFKTITRVAVDGACGSQVSVGTDGFTIFGTVAENRRNPYYQTAANGLGYGGFINLIKVDRYRISRVYAVNSQATVFFDQGCRDGVIEDYFTENCGKHDGPFFSASISSYGRPDQNVTGYQDCENPRVVRSAHRNLERGAILFAPTKGGGVVRDFVSSHTKETALYIQPNHNFNGGDILIDNPRIDTVLLSDIVAHGIEIDAPRTGSVGGSEDTLTIINPHIRNTDGSGISMLGRSFRKVRGGMIKNCGTGAGAKTYPYGPFSERFGFNPDQAFKAGDEFTQSPLQWGWGIGSTAQDIDLSDIDYRETRVSGYPLFAIQQIKAGDIPSELCKRIRFTGGSFVGPVGMSFYDSAIGGIIDTEYSIRLADTWNTPQGKGGFSVGQTWATSDLTKIVFTCGFRPSKVWIIGRSNNPTKLQCGQGITLWNGITSGGTPQCNSWFTDGTSRAQATNNKAFALIDGTATVVADLFLGFNDQGFSLQPTVNSASINVDIVAIP